MKKIVWILSLMTSINAFAAFEPLQDGKISITEGSNRPSTGAIASSISISFSGNQAKRVFELLGKTPGVTEKQETWGIARSSVSREVVCGLSKDENGADVYNCGASHAL